MLKYSLFLFVFIFYQFAFSQINAIDTNAIQVFDFVEHQPEFPGGTEGLMDYLAEHIHYPADARELGIEGKVYARIIVDHTGKVIQPKIIRGLSRSIDSTVIAVLSSMPEWQPGMMNNKAVNVYYTIPVEFRLVADMPEQKNDALIFTIAEKMPEFDGGQKALNKYLDKNLRYPQIAKDNKIHGTVFVKFVVNEDGSLSDMLVIRGIGGGCENEALRLVQEMPAWQPATQNGKPVKCYFTLPIKF